MYIYICVLIGIDTEPLRVIAYGAPRPSVTPRRLGLAFDNEHIYLRRALLLLCTAMFIYACVILSLVSHVRASTNVFEGYHQRGAHACVLTELYNRPWHRKLRFAVHNVLRVKLRVLRFVGGPR